MNLIKSIIGLSNGKSFTILHNLPNVPDVKIDDLTKKWLEISTSHNPKSLVKFINSLGYTAYTDKQFKRQGISKVKIK